jgi:hypothetical protein
MTTDAPDIERRRFRRTLIRVLAMQLITLLLLFVLQSCYGAG